jgi:tryptophan synthase beta subunit
MELSKDIRYSIERLRRSAEAALESLDRFNADQGIVSAMEAGSAVAAIADSYAMLNSVLEAEAIVAMERLRGLADADTESADSPARVVH